jgi:hypothetical protein
MALIISLVILWNQTFLIVEQFILVPVVLSIYEVVLSFLFHCLVYNRFEISWIVVLSNLTTDVKKKDWTGKCKLTLFIQLRWSAFLSIFNPIKISQKYSRCYLDLKVLFFSHFYFDILQFNNFWMKPKRNHVLLETNCFDNWPYCKFL